MPGAQEARGKVWHKLEHAPWLNGKGRGAWGLAKVRDMEGVRREATRRSESMHFVRMHELCFDKNAELLRGRPERKHTGRAVLGAITKDEKIQPGALADIASASATIEAARTLDAYARQVLKPRRASSPKYSRTP